VDVGVVDVGVVDVGVVDVDVVDVGVVDVVARDAERDGAVRSVRFDAGAVITGRAGVGRTALDRHFGAAQVAGARVDLAGVREHIDHAGALVEQYRWRQSGGIVAMNRGMLAHVTGDLDLAEQLYGQGVELIRQTGALDAEGIAGVAWVTMRVTQGRIGELEAILGAITSAPDVVLDMLALSVAAQGRIQEAREVRRGLRPVRHDFFRSLFLTMRAMVVATLAERSQAAEVYTDLLACAGQIGGLGGSAFALGPVDTPLGDLALLLGGVMVRPPTTPPRLRRPSAAGPHRGSGRRRRSWPRWDPDPRRPLVR